MKTISLSREQVEARVARYAKLKPLPIQETDTIPLAARDVIYSRKLLPVVTHEDAKSPITAARAPIQGAGGMTVTLAVCPPGTGPGLHSHHQTFETFTVLQGRFRFSWGDEGEQSIELGRFDTLSFPPGVCRAFCNVGEEEGVLQVIITGGVHDMNDIEFAPAEAKRIEQVAPEALAEFRKQGFSFGAGR